MIRISQLNLPAGHSKTELYHKAAKALHIKSEQIASLQIRRQSIDARKKPDIFLIYVVDITLNGISEQNCVSRSKNKDVSIVTERPYQFPKPGTKALRRRPVIICRSVLLLHARTKRLSSDSAGTRKGRGSAQKRCRSFLERRTLKPGIQRFVWRGRRRHVFRRQIEHSDQG